MRGSSGQQLTVHLLSSGRTFSPFPSLSKSTYMMIRSRRTDQTDRFSRSDSTNRILVRATFVNEMQLPRRVPWASLSELEQLCSWIYSDETDLRSKQMAANKVIHPLFPFNFFQTPY